MIDMELKNDIVRKYLVGKTFEEAKYVAHCMRFTVKPYNVNEKIMPKYIEQPHVCFLEIKDGIVVNAIFSHECNIPRASL